MPIGNFFQKPYRVPKPISSRTAQVPCHSQEILTKTLFSLMVTSQTNIFIDLFAASQTQSEDFSFKQGINLRRWLIRAVMTENTTAASTMMASSCLRNNEKYMIIQFRLVRLTDLVAVNQPITTRAKILQTVFLSNPRIDYRKALGTKTEADSPWERGL